MSAGGGVKMVVDLVKTFGLVALDEETNLSRIGVS